ncbi:MAG: hypothetical protein D6816_10240 [Bacteroidetes bacterium]|nr:MAG: hypothetical protein D6816_10240 [Bacteroidota bacterium]
MSGFKILLDLPGFSSCAVIGKGLKSRAIDAVYCIAYFRYAKQKEAMLALCHWVREIFQALCKEGTCQVVFC